ncbi:hypothetical protein SAMD00019534_077450 [Acytostelium subglobosum LB1]|uniref:hypothetical protein n=1 Tax=Acytostelium subglobosum LB1 TaxID=1410327 RepID=UPI0006451B88|nr:hypothetical protein SAMD00019534_077450 [Acytostelium subglobosum LB1]GAM24570.1 hypothetical protein SAMD00019534_077450 [Acytostelium subglobosum LB1]|eukprot:XP_012752239.1 hypothetical protein SAMD00019534_077450 [Acytostelium subglobosum LB1]
MHIKWLSIPTPRVTSPPPTDDVDGVLRIIEVMKGAELFKGNLLELLQFNVTETFIKEFDRVASIYPPNVSLLTYAAHYNNTVAFNHLRRHPNMYYDPKYFPNLITKHANIDMLQGYLADVPDLWLPINCIPSSVDTGNVQFVRLMLQHYGGTINLEEYNNCLDQVKFTRRGVDVSMLKMLHEEFNCLYSLTNLWLSALKHSAKCNMLDSVQYILDNIPQVVRKQGDEKEGDKEEDDDIMDYQILEKCLMRCAKIGNVTIFQAFAKSAVGIKYLKKKNISEIIDEAADRGQEAFIKHLFKHHVGNENITTRCEDKLRDLLEAPPAGGSMELAKLRPTPLAALRNDDIVSLESLFDKLDVLEKKDCLKMSESMARFISSPRATPLKFRGTSILNMVKAVGKTGSNINADIVCEFINNCQHKSTSSLYSAMNTAAGFSSKMMQLLHTKFNTDYEASNLLKAMKKKCRETMTLLFECLDKKDIEAEHSLKKAMFSYIANAPLEDVIFLLDNMDHIKSNIEICEWAVCNNRVEVFEYVIGLFTTEQFMKDTVMAELIDQAFTKNKPNLVRILQQRFETEENKPLVRPTLGILLVCGEYDACDSLEFYFNSSLFTSMPSLDRLRSLYSIQHHTYDHATHRVINLCSDYIKRITPDQHLSTQMRVEYKLTTTTNAQHASPKMEKAFHLVFNDKKLGMRVMDQIGYIFKSLGLEDEHIKGKDLLNKHCLNDYILYGATEWFIKAYSASNFANIAYMNDSLLEEAMAKCDPRAVNVLMANPYMSLKPDLLTSYFVWNASSCTSPEWERMFDEFVKITCQTAQLDISKSNLSLVKHPSFIRKLIESGTIFKQFKGRNSYIESLERSWLKEKPWSLEMLQLMMQHSLFAPKGQVRLLLKAIELGITPIVKHLVVDGNLIQQILDNPERSMCVTAEELIDHCCEQGRLEYLEMLLKVIPQQTYTATEDNSNEPGIGLRQPFLSAAMNGHLAVAERLHAIILSYGPSDSSHAIDAITDVLSNGHLDMANFILNILSSNPERCAKDTRYIDVVHERILSIELIDRMLAHPNLKCRFNGVLGNAIASGNKEVINMLMGTLPETTPIKTNYREALEQAAKIGDVDMISRILEHKPKSSLTSTHMCLLIKQIGLPDSKVTEDVFIELVNKMDGGPGQSSSTLCSLLLAATSNGSLTIIKFIVEKMSTFETGDPNSAVHKISTYSMKEIIDSCIERGDIESMEYLIQVAMKVSATANKRGYKHKISELFTLPSCNISILTHLFDKGYITVDNPKDNTVSSLVDWACKYGKSDIIRLVYQRCTTPVQLKRHLPSLNYIYLAAAENHHEVLTYLFEGDVNGGEPSPFKQSEVKLDMNRMLRSIRVNALNNGYLKIISLIDRLL